MRSIRCAYFKNRRKSPMDLRKLFGGTMTARDIAGFDTATAKKAVPETTTQSAGAALAAAALATFGAPPHDPAGRNFSRFVGDGSSD
jgi:hypothetical protein